MPHVVFAGKLHLQEWSKLFNPLRDESGEWVIKIKEIYVEQKGKQALLPVTVVEEGHPQSFYLRISCHNIEEITVRIDFETDPIKTRGVKRSVALLAEAILQTNINLNVIRHNLEGFLRM